MTQVTVNVVYLQEYDDEDQVESTLTLSFVTYAGEHTFVLGDDDAQWNVNTTQACANDTVCTIGAAGTTDVVQITPMGLTWISNTASDLFSIAGGDYKITFSRS
jgi:hypothetical protein